MPEMFMDPDTGSGAEPALHIHGKTPESFCLPETDLWFFQSRIPWYVSGHPEYSLRFPDAGNFSGSLKTDQIHLQLDSIDISQHSHNCVPSRTPKSIS